MARYAVIKVGKPLTLAELTATKAPPRRLVNPRDEDLVKLANQVSAGPESQVMPWEYEGKPATARLAATRVIRRLGVRVFVSSRPAYPGQLLFSRVPLSGRQRRES